MPSKITKKLSSNLWYTLVLIIGGVDWEKSSIEGGLAANRAASNLPETEAPI